MASVLFCGSDAATFYVSRFKEMVNEMNPFAWNFTFFAFYVVLSRQLHYLSFSCYTVNQTSDLLHFFAHILRAHSMCPRKVKRDLARCNYTYDAIFFCTIIIYISMPSYQRNICKNTLGFIKSCFQTILFLNVLKLPTNKNELEWRLQCELYANCFL